MRKVWSRRVRRIFLTLLSGGVLLVITLFLIPSLLFTNGRVSGFDPGSYSCDVSQGNFFDRLVCDTTLWYLGLFEDFGWYDVRNVHKKIGGSATEVNAVVGELDRRAEDYIRVRKGRKEVEYVWNDRLRVYIGE